MGGVGHGRWSTHICSWVFGLGRGDAVVVAPSSSSSPGENTPAWIHVSTVLGSGPLGEAKPLRRF